MYYFKKISLLIIIIGLGTTTFAQETKHQYKEHLSEILDHYLAAKDALAEDDFESAGSYISELKQEVVDKNNEVNNKNAIIEALNEAEEADNIDELRLAFKNISEYLAEIFEIREYDQETLYLQYCPMAAGGDGANWISRQEEIINPYMGEKMPSCGNTEKKINE